MSSFLFIIKVPFEDKNLKEEENIREKQPGPEDKDSQENKADSTEKDKDGISKSKPPDDNVKSEDTVDKKPTCQEGVVRSETQESIKSEQSYHGNNDNEQRTSNSLNECDEKKDETDQETDLTAGKVDVSKKTSDFDLGEWDFGEDETTSLVEGQTKGQELDKDGEKNIVDSGVKVQIQTVKDEDLDVKLLENEISDNKPENVDNEKTPLLESPESGSKSDGSSQKKFDVSPVKDIPEKLADVEKPDLQKKFKVQTVKSEDLDTGDDKGEGIKKSLDKKSSTSLSDKGEEITKKVQFGPQVSVPDESDLHSFIEQTTLIEDVENILESYDIDNYSVFKTKNGKFYTILFVDEGGERCENILNSLTDIFVGEREGTSLGIYPSSIFKGKGTDSSSNPESKGSEEEGEFRKSIKARLLVSQVVTAVQGNAEFKFDFLMLIITASIIAALGLIESSSVILVASMLVSPLMGPILAGTFGFVVKNYSLRNLGIQSEIKGLLLCVLSGFIVGLIASSIAVHYGTLGGTESWPTDEMKSRGVLRGLIPGLLIALASGVGVALSVLGGNAGSLVGVAISASLLPPAVNAGMLWAHSLVTVIRPPDVVKETTDLISNITTNQTLSTPENLICASYLNNKYIPVYSCSIEIESVYLGLVSLSLTILNIICIFLMGIIFLKIKEVAPQTSVSDETRDFWQKDIKIARESYETMKGKYSLTVGAQAKKLAEEWRSKQGQESVDEEDLDKFEDFQHLRGMIEDVENDSSVQGIQKWIPGSNRSRPFSQQLGPEFDFPLEALFSPGALPRNAYHTFHGLPRQLTSSGFFPPSRPGSKTTLRSTTPSPKLETIKESTPLSASRSDTQASTDKSFFSKFQQNHLFKRRTQSQSYDVEKAQSSHPV